MLPQQREIVGMQLDDNFRRVLGLAQRFADGGFHHRHIHRHVRDNFFGGLQREINQRRFRLVRDLGQRGLQRIENAALQRDGLVALLEELFVQRAFTGAPAVFKSGLFALADELLPVLHGRADQQAHVAQRLLKQNCVSPFHFR